MGAERKKILVVDDEKNIREAITYILKKAGYWVQSAPDGSEALVLLEKFDFDLILTDLNMPYMDGLEIIQEIQRKKPKIKIVLITASGDSGIASGADEKQLLRCLNKPIRKKDVLELTRKILG